MGREGSNNQQFELFRKWVDDYLKKHNKIVVLKNSTYIFMDGVRCSGWCDGDRMVLAKKNPLFKEVFVHEFCHMMQAVEDSEVWNKDRSFWDVLDKKSLSLKKWDKVMNIIALEHDCEKRALKISKQWDLFDNEQYAQYANMYLYYHQYVFLMKYWQNHTAIYRQELLDLMPKKLIPLENFNNINIPLMQKFNKYLAKKSK
jgi:hypothetical protein